MAVLDTSMVQVHPYRLRDGMVEHLLLRRSAHEEYGPGIWQVITGGIEPNENSVDAARREVLEETGLLAIEWHALPGVAMFYFAAADSIVLSPIFACRLHAEAIPVLSDEHSEFRWMTADDACELLAFPTHVQGVKDVEGEIQKAK